MMEINKYLKIITNNNIREKTKEKNKLKIKKI